MLHSFLAPLIAALALRDAPPPTAVASTEPARVVEDAHRAGFGAAFHTGRRALLASKLGSGLVLVRGLPATRDYVRFSQDKAFWYLTGVESPGASLLVDVVAKKEILFLPKRNAMTEMWEGELWDAEDAWVSGATGIADVRPSGELMSVLKDLAVERKIVWIPRDPWVAIGGCHDRAMPHDRALGRDPLDGRTSREDALAASLQKLGVEVRDLSPVLNEMRRVKTSEEIDALRRASEIGAEAMSEGIRSTSPGVGEWQIEAVMTFVQRRDGAEGPAYHAIVGSGTNALRLHYAASTRRMLAGEMLLVDYAPEVDHYASDITRSWPVDGKFTPRMAEIYDAVLEAQLAGIAAVKPGRTMEEIDKACRKVLYAKGLGKLMPHGACHYIGMEVHDVGDNTKPLEPGVVFTVEPGVYEEATGIGVRIEDVVVVTENGCEVITGAVPKDRRAIVELVAAPGLLDASIPRARTSAEEPPNGAAASASDRPGER